MSAMPLTIASLKSARHCVVFQLLKPIGGVRARPLGSANAGCGGEAASVINPAAAPVAAAVAVSRAAVNAAASLVLRMGAPVGWAPGAFCAQLLPARVARAAQAPEVGSFPPVDRAA